MKILEMLNWFKLKDQGVKWSLSGKGSKGHHDVLNCCCVGITCSTTEGFKQSRGDRATNSPSTLDNHLP